MITKLPDLLKSHAHFATERAKMMADDQRARETEARILQDGVIDDEEIQSLTNARTARELIARRLPTIEEALRKLEEQIQRELQSCAQRYNRAVRNAVEAMEARIIAANQEFWTGRQRDLKKWVESATIPAVRAISRARFDCGFNAESGLDFWATQARGFLDRTKLAIEKFKLVIN